MKISPITKQRRINMRRECYRTLLVAFLLFPTAVLMAAGGKIHGKVTDHETGEALVGATVRVDGTSFGATTDANGVYNIVNIDAGTYILKASSPNGSPPTASNRLPRRPSAARGSDARSGRPCPRRNGNRRGRGYPAPPAPAR